MACDHNINLLVGMADGIHCRGCGQIFKHIPTQDAPAKKAPAAKDAPAKKAPAKRATRKGAK